MPKLSDPVTAKEIRIIATETGFSEHDLENIYLRGHQPGPAMRKRLERIMYPTDGRRFFTDGRTFLSDAEMAVPLDHESGRQGLPPDGYALRVIPAAVVEKGMLMHTNSGAPRKGKGQFLVGWITVTGKVTKNDYAPDEVCIPTSAGTVYTHRHQIVRVAVPQ